MLMHPLPGFDGYVSPTNARMHMLPASSSSSSVLMYPDSSKTLRAARACLHMQPTQPAQPAQPACLHNIVVEHALDLNSRHESSVTPTVLREQRPEGRPLCLGMGIGTGSDEPLFLRQARTCLLSLPLALSKICPGGFFVRLRACVCPCVEHVCLCLSICNFMRVCNNVCLCICASVRLSVCVSLCPFVRL